MIRLLGAELRADWRAHAGLLVVAAVGALAFGVGASMLETGLRLGGEYLDGFSSAAMIVLIFSGVSGIAVVAAVARLAVELGRPSYARWQLAGVGPARTVAIVLAQLVVMCVLGAVLGFGVTLLIAEPIVQQAFADGSGGYEEVAITTGPLTALITIGGMAVIGVLGGFRAAMSAGRTPALVALREPEPSGKRMRWWRWVLFGLVLVNAGAFLVNLWIAQKIGIIDDRMAVLSQLPLIAPLITIVIVTGGPIFYPLVLRGWTAILPARVSSAWYLARHQARYHLGRSTASVTPLFTGAAMLGGLYTSITTWTEAARAAGEPSNRPGIAQMVIILGGPVLLASCGAAVVIFMSNRTQAREQALLVASGASQGVILRAALWQAVIHVATAALLALFVIAVTGVICAGLLAPYYSVVVPRIELGETSMLFAIGFVLTVIAVVVPVALRSRESVTGVLGRE